jgi:predicted transcriptional regulator
MTKSKSKTAEVLFRSGEDLCGLLRSIVDDSGMTRYAIAQKTGLAESTLSRMYTGTRPATMETIAVICQMLGKRVVVRVEDAP